MSLRIIKDGSAKQTLVQCRAQIEAGHIVAFRTETFYGLGVNPLNASAVRAVRDLKHDLTKATLILVSDTAQAARFVEYPSPLFQKLLNHPFELPLTVVEKSAHLVPQELTAGNQTVGVRLPKSVRVREFVATCGGALTATSANIAGQPPARTAAEVADYFAAADNLLIVDDGASDANVSAASTVVDVSSGQLKLVREGELAFNRLVEYAESDNLIKR